MIIHYEGGGSDEEINEYIDMPVTVMPKIKGSLIIGLFFGIISFLCMKGKHYLFSIWFFVIFIISMILSYSTFFGNYPYWRPFFPEKLMLLLYAFCNLYVGYKKVRDHWRKKTESGKIEDAVGASRSRIVNHSSAESDG